MLTASSVNRVDEIVAQAQSQGRAPSIVASVIRDGRIAHITGAGETPVPGRDTQYRIGSISKSLTAAIILALRDEGRLSLDDPIGEYLSVKGAPGAVRLRELLSHTAGLQQEPDGPWWERNPGGPLDELVAGVTEAKLAFGRYERHHYSNLGYGLLGGVIERFEGRTWWSSVRERVLDPLGMSRTTYDPQEPFAKGYVLHPYDQTVREEPNHDAAAMAPAGQLWSTAADLSTWAAYLARPTGSVLAPESVAQMTHPAVLADPDAWTSGYGLGLQLWRQGERVYVGHTGSMPGYLAVLAVHRPSGTGVVAFANTYSLPPSIRGLGLSILEAVLDAEPSAPPTPWRPAVPPPAEIEPLCGLWWWMGRQFAVRWDDVRSELVLEEGRGASRFVQQAPDQWRGVDGTSIGETLLVRRDADGAVSELDIATFVYTRDPLPDI